MALLWLDFLIAVCSRCQRWSSSSAIPQGLAARRLIQTARYRYLAILSGIVTRGIAIRRYLGRTGIDTFGIAILTEVSQVSHHTSYMQRLSHRSGRTTRYTVRPRWSTRYAVTLAWRFEIKVTNELCVTLVLITLWNTCNDIKWLKARQSDRTEVNWTEMPVQLRCTNCTKRTKWQYNS